MKLISSKKLDLLNNIDKETFSEKKLGINFGSYFKSDIKIGDHYEEFNPMSVYKIDEESCFYKLKQMKKDDILFSINEFFILQSDEFDPQLRWINSKNGEIVRTGDLPLLDGQTVTIEFLSKKVTKLNQPKTLFIDSEESHFDKKTFDIEFHWCYEVDQNFYDKLKNKIEILKLNGLDKKIKKNLFNQDKAIDEVIKSIKLNATGFKEKNKPVGSYLLTGPTGVGKTELAKILAKELDWDLVKIDMSEYIQSHSISRLIGSPPSYVGYGDKSILENDVNNRKVVLLLDEMEKAHQDVQKVFLQAMDNAKVTLGNGNEVDFSKALILMTSNCGVIHKNEIGLNSKDSVLSINNDEIKTHFIPEFLGRLSGILEFNPIDEESCVKIIDKLVKDFSNELVEKNISIKFTESSKILLLKNGFNKQYGARPLKNYFRNTVVHKVVEKIFDNEINNYSDEFGYELLIDSLNNDFLIKQKNLSLIDLINRVELF